MLSVHLKWRLDVCMYVIIYFGRNSEETPADRSRTQQLNSWTQDLLLLWGNTAMLVQHGLTLCMKGRIVVFKHFELGCYIPSWKRPFSTLYFSTSWFLGAVPAVSLSEQVGFLNHLLRMCTEVHMKDRAAPAVTWRSKCDWREGPSWR